MARTTAAPSASTGTERRLPPKVPTGVRSGATMAARRMACTSHAPEARLALLGECLHGIARILCHAATDHIAQFHLAGPLQRLIECGMHIVLDIAQRVGRTFGQPSGKFVTLSLEFGVRQQ